MARHRCHELTQEVLLECEGTMSLQVQLDFVGLSLKQQDDVKSCHKPLAVPKLVNDHLIVRYTKTKHRLYTKGRTGAQQLAASLMHGCTLRLNTSMRAASAALCVELLD